MHLAGLGGNALVSGVFQFHGIGLENTMGPMAIFQALAWKNTMGPHADFPGPTSERNPFRVHGPMGPWGPWARAHGPGPGPWARALPVVVFFSQKKSLLI